MKWTENNDDVIGLSRNNCPKSHSRFRIDFYLERKREINFFIKLKNTPTLINSRNKKYPHVV